MARRLILGGLAFQLSDTHDISDLALNLMTAIKNKQPYEVGLIDHNTVVVNCSNLEYFMIWEEVEGKTPPVAEVSSMVK